MCCNPDDPDGKICSYIENGPWNLKEKCLGLSIYLKIMLFEQRITVNLLQYHQKVDWKTLHTYFGAMTEIIYFSNFY